MAKIPFSNSLPSPVRLPKIRSIAPNPAKIAITKIRISWADVLLPLRVDDGNDGGIHRRLHGKFGGRRAGDQGSDRVQPGIGSAPVFFVIAREGDDGDGVQGMWLPWQSVANGEPIAKMLDTFNVMNVKDLKDVPIEELRAILYSYGVGGNQHRKF